MEGQPPNKKVRYSDDHLGASVGAGGVGGMAGPTGLEYPKMRVAELRAELKVHFAISSPIITKHFVTLAATPSALAYRFLFSLPLALILLMHQP